MKRLLLLALLLCAGLAFPEDSGAWPALRQGEREYAWHTSPFVIKGMTTVADEEGCVISPVFESSDYGANCDSRYAVSIAATEAVEESEDDPIAGDEQGGVRIVRTADGLELQGLVKADTGSAVWKDLGDARLGEEYVVSVAFHYEKDQDGERAPTSVTYRLDKTTLAGGNPTAKLNVSEVFVSRGTRLPRDLMGECQLGAVVVDVELVPGDELPGLGDTEKEADAAVAKLKVGIADAVKAVLSTAEAQETYRSYFRIVARKTVRGYVAQVVFRPEVASAIETELDGELEKVVAAFNAGESVEIAAKPGLYYGVRRGDDPRAMETVETTLATGGKVAVAVTRPDGTKRHFYRLVCSPTEVKR